MALDEMAVRREIVLPVDRDIAWQALNDPDELATWLADEVDLQIEEGAQGWIRWEGGEQRHATIEEVVPRRRIVMRWAGPDGPETVVELVLDDVPDGTRLVVVELPVAQLEAIGVLIERGTRVLGGPQMVAVLA